MALRKNCNPEARSTFATYSIVKQKAGIISSVPRHEKTIFCLSLCENLVYIVTAHMSSVFVFAA